MNGQGHAPIARGPSFEAAGRRRRYRIDETGITESDPDGFPLRAIAWDGLAVLDSSILHSTDGTRISLDPLGNDRRDFARRVREEFASRCPVAYRHYREWAVRRAWRCIFIVFPCYALLPQVVCFAVTGFYHW